jgi:2-C-methyl-D-erythritol 4-phosphate cytidylyltransferase
MIRCSAILLAAGRSQRLGFDKILTPLAGKPVLHYALEALLAAPQVAEIVLTTRPDLLASMRERIAALNPAKPVRVIEGGKERQDSVFLGLQACDAAHPVVLIHDAARPLLTPELIARLVAAAEKKGAVVAASRATDTLKTASPEGKVEETLDRSKIWQMQTPQVFLRDLIAGAYAKVQQDGKAITDDAAAAEYAGHPVFLEETTEPNLKITRQADWDLLELMMRQKLLGELRVLLHETGNRLSPITGYLPLLSKYGGDDPKFRDYLAKMEMSGQGVQEILQQVHAMTRRIFPREGEDRSLS